MENISFFDIALVSLLVIFGVKGLLTGIIKETFGLIGIIGGIFLASRYAQQAGDLIDANIYHIQNKAAVYFIGFATVLILFWIASIFVGFIFTKLINLSGLGFINKILGFVVGSLKIFLLFSVVIFALRSVDIFKKTVDKKLTNSYFYPYLIKTGSYIVKFNIEDDSSSDNNTTQVGKKVSDMNITINK